MQRLLRLGGGRLPRAAVLVGAGGAAAGGALLLHTTATSAQCLVDEAARPAAGLPSAAVLDQLKFKETHKGQLTPPAPLEGASETSCGPTAHDGSGIVWQRGPYRSWWLRLGIGLSRLPSFAQLSTALDEAIQRAKETKPFGTAVYVGVQELAMEPGISSLLRARGFQYHHFHASRGRDSSGGAGSEYEPGEHIYYRWLGDPTHDLVPPYRTSIEGVGALLLSPDEKRVLLVWEYGNWKPVSGAVDEGESSLRTIEREMHEEVHVPLDHSFIARKVGGWQMARARDGRTNDNYVCYALRAGSEAFEVCASGAAVRRRCGGTAAVRRCGGGAAVRRRWRRARGIRRGKKSATRGALVAACAKPCSHLLATRPRATPNRAAQYPTPLTHAAIGIVCRRCRCCCRRCRSGGRSGDQLGALV